jgi:hypothetical protein
MNNEFYKTPKSSSLKRLFWKAAGADRHILERCTYSDQVKYMSLGGIIVATGIMAGIAGGYAFYTIFSERGSAIEHDADLWVTIKSTIFGIFWGLMIFNLDRFIVSSTGKGDGTEAITWQEFKSAIPRIIMGAIIAITIAKPVEIRMFKSEIDVALHKVQMQKQREYLSQIDSIYEGRIEAEKRKLEKWEQEIQIKESRYVELENLFAAEMAGKHSGIQGYGDRAKKIEEQMKRLDHEINMLKSKNKPLINQSYETLKKFEAEKNESIKSSEFVAAGLDGLLERIKLVHKIAGWEIILFITLLFMAIELTPIFFKLMLIKSPYDFLKENIDDIIKAESGIYVQQNYYKDRNGLERDLVIHTQANRIVSDAVDIQLAQKRLNEYAISKYEEMMRKRIDEDPEAYIQTSGPKES